MMIKMVLQWDISFRISLKKRDFVWQTRSHSTKPSTLPECFSVHLRKDTGLPTEQDDQSDYRKYL
ncbi:hypothetical protein VA7868_02296 [Vibrio aerogenes CECT 7868]|uniref:Uncharacterized protein n=1 Tax=Vibrio aerogenes CECT 7868 TaxID=1216006 RepID=A0A1M5Z4V3_9VIBR|nr:hypothetical protein [Vibrio aerogenes]SHI19282.1 hypothetical protein VA7868_02296 [Vibrio aerogenes CECT 7868]